ncbi:hypothetical protein MYX19_01305 [Nitrospinae bacterium AH-259-F20]|nr:hypothetical protein [Nitrospinae bacterium AH-259-F20]
MSKEPLIPISWFSPDLQAHPLAVQYVLEAFSSLRPVGFLSSCRMMGFWCVDTDEPNPLPRCQPNCVTINDLSYLWTSWNANPGG